MHFSNIIQEAINLNNQKNKIAFYIIRRISSPKNRDDPNQAVTAVAKTFVFSGSKLSGQIIEAVQRGHLLLAVLGIRPLFEMMVNTSYTFNHPLKHKKDAIRHARKVCEEIIGKTNDTICFEREVEHSKIDGKTIRGRARKVKMLKLYEINYKGLSDWSHLMMRSPYISKPKEGEKFGINLASQTLCLIHDVFEPICKYFNIVLDRRWEEGIIQFRNKYEIDFLGGDK